MTPDSLGPADSPQIIAALKHELAVSVAQHTATSEILRVISESPNDVKPVFDAIVLSAVRLFDCDLAFFLRCHGDTFSPAALAGSDGSHIPLDPALLPIDPAINFPSRVFVSGQNLHLPDWSAIELPEHERHIHETYGINSSLFVPLLLRGGECIGLLALASSRARTFNKSEIELAETFRDQAVIAIENARHFRKTEQALERQTATADVLKIIAASPTNVQPVFEAIVQTAFRLFGCETAFILRCDERSFWPAAWCRKEGLLPVTNSGPVPIEPDANFPSRAIRSMRTLHLADWSEIELPEFERRIRRELGYNCAVYFPLLHEGECLGVLGIAGSRPRMFTEVDIALGEAFRDQAVIAIENTRLFNEVEAKTRDLSESLQQQTATADVLKVISRSAFDLQAVFDTLARSAADLCGVRLCGLHIREGDVLVCRGYAGATKEQDEFVRRTRIPISDTNYLMSRALSSGEIFNIGDFENDRRTGLPARTFQQVLGFKALLFIPLLREGQGIGLFVLGRDQVGEFSQRHIEVAQTFADQAVIAIENTRLFNEVQTNSRDLQEALRYQTGSANILNVIASSPTDVEPVLKAIVESACELCEAHDAVVLLKNGGDLCFSAHHGPIPINTDRWPIGRGWASGRAVVDRTIVHVHDIYAEDDFTDGRELSRRAGSTAVRSILAAPLLREGESIGAILLRRQEVRPFNDKQIAMLQTFADQAVIAIENAQLFDEVQQRTRELSKSLDELRTAQDRLVQTEKLASLGQLTAGIAHEIKNPLNFVNNFSALSVELVDELDETLVPAPLDQKMRGNVGELTAMLKSNLEKVVQHGKRADAIVKNMLLHSRDGSGEQRPVDINTLLDESVNLAYHGARAEKPEFNITLQRDLDPDAGTIDVFPQEMTRAFINLISNGFYAASKRKTENGEADFEPVLSAATRNLGKSVEIRIRDNGTGILAEVRDKMFNPFFTTKPTGEGTGLGLSMTHDIVVKQHAGRIDVETQPGVFTEFIITLPRDNGTAARQKPE